MKYGRIDGIGKMAFEQRHERSVGLACSIQQHSRQRAQGELACLKNSKEASGQEQSEQGRARDEVEIQGREQTR